MRGMLPHAVCAAVPWADLVFCAFACAVRCCACRCSSVRLARNSVAMCWRSCYRGAVPPDIGVAPRYRRRTACIASLATNVTCRAISAIESDESSFRLKEVAFAALGTMVDDAEEVDPEVATRLVAATLRLVDSATRVRYPRRRMWSCE